MAFGFYFNNQRENTFDVRDLRNQAVKARVLGFFHFSNDCVCCFSIVNKYFARNKNVL